MNRILITLFSSLIICFSYAQSNSDSSKHLTFKGIPLDGTLDQYVSKMKQYGFKHVSTKDGIAMLEGDFAGYKDCYVNVSTLKQKDLLHKISILFPEKETWSTLSGNYFDLKMLLIEKYGKPSEMVEKFDVSYEPKDDGSKMNYVQLDRCKFYSIWNIDKGEIKLSIDHNSITSCFVRLNYFDKSNGAEIKKHALDDL